MLTYSNSDNMALKESNIINLPLPKEAIKKEFSSYKKYSNLVESIVNRDEPIEKVAYFYESLSLTSTTSTATRYTGGPILGPKVVTVDQPPPLVVIRYFIDIDAAIDFLLTNGESCIAVCKIRFSSSKTPASAGDTHAICFIRKKDKYYLYDPNGPVLNDSEYKFGYRYQSNITTRQLILALYNNFNINIDYENYNVGIQAFAPDKIETTFISSGGYCMFFVYLFIKHIISRWKTNELTDADIGSIIHYKYKKKIINRGIFKYTTKDFEKLTVTIINDIFDSQGSAVGDREEASTFGSDRFIGAGGDREATASKGEVDIPTAIQL